MTVIPEKTQQSEQPAHRLKRLNMRAARRGTKEMDLILGPFAQAHLPAMTAPELDTFERLLNENDHDLYQWVTAQVAPPADLTKIIGKITQFSGLF